MKSKIALFPFAFFVSVFVHIENGHTLPIEDCENFHVSQSSTELEISSKTIPVLRTKCLEGLDRVKSLVLKNCQIEEIEPDAFVTMESLVTVDLSNNFLYSLPENLFSNNKLLERVSLKNNKFTVVPKVDVSLSELDLSRNEISSLDLIDILDVKKLNLEYNELNSISPHDLEMLKKVEMIILSNNPWKCDTGFNELLCWSLTRIDGNSRNPIKCFSQTGFNIPYTMPRIQELCEIQAESTDSSFFVPTMPKEPRNLPDPVYKETLIEKTDSKMIQDQAIIEETSSVPHASFPGESKKPEFYKSRSSAVKEFVSGEDDVNLENVKKWEVIAFIGWMFAAVVVAVAAYILYAYKLSLKENYRRINEDNISQVS